MKPLQRTLFILGLLFLVTQIIHQAYVRFLQPRRSVLDRYEPLREEIRTAKSLDELLAKYDESLARVKAYEAEPGHPKEETPEFSEPEPYKTRNALRAAITDWEQHAHELRRVWCYWLAGLALLILGLFLYWIGRRWLGLSLLVIGFSETIYWSTPYVFATFVKEFDRLVTHRLLLSTVTLALLLLAARVTDTLDGRPPAGKE